MILKETQADAIYRAMVAMNNVYGIIETRVPVSTTAIAVVKEQINDGIIVVTLQSGGAIRAMESYENQNAFAKAYGLE